MKKIRHFRLSAAMLVFSGSSLMAQTISEQDAMEKAKHFMSSNQLMNKAASRDRQLSLAYTSKADGNTFYYVFNQPGGGFVIVGGDEAAQEILGFSSSGNFDLGQLPDGMKWMLQSYDEHISEAISQVKAGEAALDAMKANTRGGARYNVRPLLGEGDLAIQYDQSSPYNLAIDGGNGRFLTGCVTTAAVQVMASWNCPTQDNGLKFASVQLADGGSYGTAPAITGPYTYNWSTIQRNYSSSQKYNLNDANVKDLATLMYRVSRAIGADYGVKATSASVRELGKVMITNFGYDKGMMYQDRKRYNDATWEQMIYDELDAGRSVILGGDDVYGGGGHAFVCDGYDASADTYHINWGWGGYCDGYFAMSGASALMPNGSGSGGAGLKAAYSKEMEALIGIEPAHGTSYIYNMWADDLNIKVPEISKGKTVSLEGTFWNNTYTEYNDVFGIGFFEEGTNEGVIAESSFTYKLGSFSGTSPISVSMPESLVAGKRYLVVPYYKEGGQWKQFQLNNNTSIPVITIKEEDHSVKAYCLPWKLYETSTPIGSMLAVQGGGFGNDGDFEAEITFGFKFTNVNDENDFAYSESKTSSLKPGYYMYGISVLFPGSLIEGRTYRVSAVYRDDTGAWQPCRPWEAFDEPKIKMTKATNLIVTQEPAIGMNSQVTPGSYSLVAMIKNPTSATLSKDIVVFLDYKSVLYKTFTFAPGEEKPISFKVDVPALGSHPLMIDNYSDDVTMFSTTIKVVEKIDVNKDLNGDKKVSVADVVVFNNDEAMGQAPDLNLDGKVDDKDRQVIVGTILKQ